MDSALYRVTSHFTRSLPLFGGYLNPEVKVRNIAPFTSARRRDAAVDVATTSATRAAGPYGVSETPSTDRHGSGQTFDLQEPRDHGFGEPNHLEPQQ